MKNTARNESENMKMGLLPRSALVLSIIFMHFMLFSPAGFPLTITPLSLLIFFLVTYRVRITATTFFGGGLIIFSPFLVLIEYSALGGGVDMGEFMKTYILWISSTSLLWLSVRGRIRRYVDNTRPFVLCVLIILGFASLQMILAKYFGSTALYNPFGEFNYLGPYDLVRHVNEKRIRAPAFYLEPSFCAFVLFFLISSIVLFRIDSPRVVQASLTCGVIGTWWVGSASGMMAFAVLAILLLASSIRNRGLKSLAFGLLLVMSIAAALIVLPERLAEVSDEGTSGYWRLVAPLIILSKVLTSFPLGVPFGQIEAFVIPLGLSHAGKIGSSIDNGVYYFTFYFGWFGVLFALWILSRIIRAVYKSEVRKVVMWWYVFASLQFSGGVLLSEYVYPLLLVIYAYRCASYSELTLRRRGRLSFSGV